MNILSKHNKSILLLGPRQVGKSTLINRLNPDLTINLMDESEFMAFARNPNELQQRLRQVQPKSIFIDEVQRIPQLLNTLQTLIDGEYKKCRFFLTGSSARKLRRGQANLLPGRIFTYNLGPLVIGELIDDIPLQELLCFGSLPGILFESDLESRRKMLRSYASTYLKEEIQAEALTKNIEGFSRFLFVVASWSGRHIDLSKVSTESGVPRQTCTRYLEILTDTLLVHILEPFHKSGNTKRLIQHPKFFWFDVGVLNGLLGSFQVSVDRIGLLFETFLLGQIRHLASALDREIQMYSWRTSNNAEVDAVIVVDDVVYALEIKSSSNVGVSDLSGLKRFADWYRRPCHLIVAYHSDVEKNIDGIEVLPWRSALRKLFSTS